MENLSFEFFIFNTSIPKLLLVARGEGEIHFFLRPKTARYRRGGGRAVFWPRKVKFLRFFQENLYLGSFGCLLMTTKICLKIFENWIFPG